MEINTFPLNPIHPSLEPNPNSVPMEVNFNFVPTERNPVSVSIGTEVNSTNFLPVEANLANQFFDSQASLVAFLKTEAHQNGYSLAIKRYSIKSAIPLTFFPFTDASSHH